MVESYPERNVYESFKGTQGSIREVYVAAALALLVTIIGTSGFMIIEGWSLLDAVFMTVITLSTVGYSEVRPLSQLGMVFSLFLIIAGVGVAFYSFTAISRSLIVGEFLRLRGFHKMQKSILKLKGHTIVCGYGTLAKIVSKELAEAGQDVVVIEQDDTRLRQLEAQELLYVEGSAYDEDSLKAAGIDNAKTLLSLLRHDADNVFVSLTARDLNPKISIIARSEDESGEKKLRRAGANDVISPYLVSGTQLAHKLVRPNVSTFLEFTSNREGKSLVLEELRVTAESPIKGQTLEQSDVRRKTGAMIAAIIGDDGSMRLSPSGETVMNQGDTLIALGDPESVEKLGALL